MEVVNHYNIRRVVDIYANVQDRDLGGVSAPGHEDSQRRRKLACRAAPSSR